MVIDNLYWKTKDGRKINVDDMDDQHVRNAFKMILRKLKSKEDKIKAKPFKVELNGDMAQQFNEQNEYDDLAELFYYHNV